LEPQSLFPHEKFRYQIGRGWLDQNQPLLVILANREKEKGPLSPLTRPIPNQT
jgi:hypothetical protein